jgi:RNA polymerase sigma-70 factor (ECF subfamily)
VIEDNIFHKLFISSRESMKRVIARIVPPHEIEDIVQETYVRLCQVNDESTIHSPKSFMFTTARNLALDYQKQANVKLVDKVDDWQVFEEILNVDAKDEVYKQVVSDNHFTHFCDAIRQLPTQTRKVFVLKKVYGYSQKEIAQELSLSESTIEKHISNGTKRCMLFMRKNQQGSTSSQQTQTRQGGSHE